MLKIYYISVCDTRYPTKFTCPLLLLCLNFAPPISADKEGGVITPVGSSVFASVLTIPLFEEGVVGLDNGEGVPVLLTRPMVDNFDKEEREEGGGGVRLLKGRTLLD